MRRQTRTFLALVAGFGLLIGIIVVQQWLQTQRQQSTLLANPGEIHNILIQPSTPGTSSYKLQRGAAGWALVAPESKPALTERVDVILRLLELPTQAATQQISVYPVTALDLNAVGLLQPRLQVGLENHNFFFGGRDLQGQRRYIRHEDNIYLATDVVFPLLSTGYDLLVAGP